MAEVILDVREKDEFQMEHIENSISLPLSDFACLASGVLNQIQGRSVWVLCRSGSRAKLALNQISQLGYGDKVKAEVYAGGILEWKKQGKPVVRGNKIHLPIMRQAQLAAGLILLTGTALGAFVNPWFFSICAFVGTGLTIAGSTGFCGMARLLAFMPWNKTH